MSDGKQYILSGLDLNDDVLLIDLWDKGTAIRLIVNGLLSPRITELSHRLVAHLDNGDDINAAHDAVFAAQKRAIRLADSSIAAGNIKEIDTRENWLKWAVSKGYSINHLSTQKVTISAPTAPDPLPIEKKPKATEHIDFVGLSSDAYITKTELAIWLSRSESSINRDIKGIPNFPKPHKTGSRSVRFKVDDVRKYLASLTR